MEYRTASAEDIGMLMDIRLEMLRTVNSLPEDYEFSEELISHSRHYFINGDHTTVLAIDNGRAVGCASICFF